MIPIFGIIFYRQAKLLPGHKNHFVRRFRLNCPDKVFHTGIHLRSERRQFFDLYPDGFKDRVEPFVEQVVAVMNQIFFAGRKSTTCRRIRGNMRAWTWVRLSVGRAVSSRQRRKSRVLFCVIRRMRTFLKLHREFVGSHV